MKTAGPLRAMVLAAACGCVAAAAAADFVNLDFEQATVPPGATFLSWAEAAPGWSHSAGDDTDHVNYLLEHVGFSQNYVLLDAAHSPFGAATGQYAMAMKSGRFLAHDPTSDFTVAFLAQTGTVPVGAQWLSLLASEYWVDVQLGGMHLPLTPVGLDPSSPTYASDLLTYSGEWRADISSFAGQTLELRISGVTPTTFEQRLLVVDQIHIHAIPEPATVMLLGAGAVGLIAFMRRTGRTRGRDAQRS